MSKDHLPLVSIFVPSFNSEKYIEECLESVVNQTYRNIEILVGDDCSFDSTPNILSKYATDYPCLKVVQNPENVGVTRNCNSLLKHCNGDFILFFAADDVLQRNCVERALFILMKYPEIAIVFHEVLHIDEFSKPMAGLTRKCKSHSGSVSRFLKWGVYFPCNGMVVRKSSIPEEGYDEALRSASDFDFIIRCLKKEAKSYYYLDENLSMYRRHSASVSQSRQAACVYDNLVGLIKLHQTDPYYVGYYKMQMSEIFRGARHGSIWDYKIALLLSLTYHPFNYKTLILLVIYLFFGIRR